VFVAQHRSQSLDDRFRERIWFCFYTLSHRDQYFGTVGSTSSDHRRIPPTRFFTLR
jgi:hypothetical protein